MKKYLLLFSAFLLINTSSVKAQVLNVPEVIQEHDQWCWAGVTKSALDYYGYSFQQCDIAEYARSVITWTSYGTTDCCVDPNVGCNYWNYLWGYPGSIDDILMHFGSIPTTAVGSSLTLSDINTEIANNHPFVVRWGWAAGGGHFVLGHGLNGNDVYYMNPWFGEGLHVSTYSWLVSDGNHTWTHSELLNSAPTAINDLTQQSAGDGIYPNPSTGDLWIKLSGIAPATVGIKIFNQLGETVFEETSKQIIGNEPALINLHQVAKGIYTVQIKENQTDKYMKLVLQ
ncbi:MAG: T9SS type A sorting domain-containing protein [Bacteroidia bacterium]